MVTASPDGSQPEAITDRSMQTSRRACTFAAVDADKSGQLDLEELLSALAAAGDVADRAEVEALFKRLDVNGDGSITMEEWQAGHSGGGLRVRLDAAVKRGQLSLPPPDEDDEPEYETRRMLMDAQATSTYFRGFTEHMPVLCESLSISPFDADETILQEGEEGTWLGVLLKGSCGRARASSCSPTASRLQPYAFRLQSYASRLQPYASRLQPYTSRLQSYASQVSWT